MKKHKNAETQHDSNCVMFLGSKEQLEVVLSSVAGKFGKPWNLWPSKMHTFVKEAKGKAGKNVLSGKEVVGNIGSLKSERKNVKTIRSKSNILPPFRQSYDIIFLHPVLKEICTHFIFMYKLGASRYYVNWQIRCTDAIAYNNSGETEEVQ